jgi:hypothetical protein
VPHPLALSCEGSFSRVRFFHAPRVLPLSGAPPTITCSPGRRRVLLAAGPGAFFPKSRPRTTPLSPSAPLPRIVIPNAVRNPSEVFRLPQWRQRVPHPSFSRVRFFHPRALGHFLTRKRLRNSTSVTVCASGHPRSRKVLMFDSEQSCDMLLWVVKVSDSGHRFTLTEERNTVEQSRGK